jgi:hypothetical protein
MTLAEASQRIGTEVATHIDGPTGARVWIYWTVTDYKTSYGHDRWRLTPKAGTGEMWFETDSIMW